MLPVGVTQNWPAYNFVLSGENSAPYWQMLVSSTWQLETIPVVASKSYNSVPCPDKYTCETSFCLLGDIFSTPISYTSDPENEPTVDVTGEPIPDAVIG